MDFRRLARKGGFDGITTLLSDWNEVSQCRYRPEMRLRLLTRFELIKGDSFYLSQLT